MVATGIVLVVWGVILWIGTGIGESAFTNQLAGTPWEAASTTSSDLNISSSSSLQTVAFDSIAFMLLTADCLRSPTCTRCSGRPSS